MKNTNPYLNFDGETREAMTFYAKCLGSTVEMQTFKEAGMPGPTGTEDRVVHASIPTGSSALMASDTMPGQTFNKGNNFYINVNCDDVDEQVRIFQALGEGGKVLMELQDTFWGARFGMLTDKFGINWMFNCEIAK